MGGSAKSAKGLLNTLLSLLALLAPCWVRDLEVSFRVAIRARRSPCDSLISGDQLYVLEEHALELVEHA